MIMNFKKIKLSESSTQKLKTFKSKTGLTPNIVCRLALALSINEGTVPSIELFADNDSGQEIARYVFTGDLDLPLISIYKMWVIENEIIESDQYSYFMAHINRGIELLTSRVKSLDQFSDLL